MFEEHGEVKVNGMTVSLTVVPKEREKTEELYVAYRQAQRRLINHLEQQAFVMVTHSEDK